MLLTLPEQFHIVSARIGYLCSLNSDFLVSTKFNLCICGRSLA